MRLDVIEAFAEAQSWVHAAIARAEMRHAWRLQEQRARWEETRRLTLAVSAAHRQRRAESQSKYERKRWSLVKADPAKRAAHNAKRMAAYYRKKVANSLASADSQKARKNSSDTAKIPSKQRVHGGFR